MALNKFEKDIQQKLSNREIKPSANSWDRLDAMLSVEEKPKKKRGFNWFYVAASLLLFISLGYYLYIQNQDVKPLNEEIIIVEENSEFNIQHSENKEENPENRESVKEVLVENNILIKEPKNSSIHNQKIVAAIKINNQQLTTNNQIEVSIINQSSGKTTITNSEINNQQSTINNKYVSAEKLLAEISDNNFENKTTTKRVVKKTRKGISVNPNVLLSNAETELNQSFRESALDKLNKNFNSIKTVLANRNYEE